MISITDIGRKKRRGISQIIGSLFMLAIVTVVGSALFIQGLQGVTDFNTFLAVFSEEGESESVHESIIIEHVRFDPSSKDVDFYLRNTGEVRAGVDRITMVRVDTQELIINEEVDEDIFGKDIIKVTITVTLLPFTPNGSCTDWSDTGCSNEGLEGDEYRISVTTGRGNSFETVAAPFNT